MERIAIFPGSFDPFTLGHQMVVADGLKLFDRIIIGVGINTSKQGLLPVGKRLELIGDLYRGEPRVGAVTYDGLTVDFAREQGAQYILRGLRNGVDFEFERNMMQVNQTLNAPPAEEIHPDFSFIKDIPVQLSVELGRARLPIKDILKLGQGSVVELSAQAGEPMDVLINGMLIAQGEIVSVNGNYGVRLTDIITPAERLNRLNRPFNRR